VAQVAGRAGRGAKPGRVFIQTHQPEARLMQALVAGDPRAFYAAETETRRDLGLPPFGRLAAIIVSSEDRDRADLVQQIVALRLGTPMETLQRKSRLTQSALRTRRVSLYLAHVALGWPLERVGHAFGINRQTVGTACTRIEQARGEPDLNDLLDQLAETIQTLCETPPVTDLPEVA
jgi:hypothetical protein